MLQMSNPAQILELRKSHISKRATYAIPGGETPGPQIQSMNPPGVVPVRELLGFDLPDAQICDVLVETYFFAVHWFTLVIYEPKFRSQYRRITTTGFASRSEYSFLLLLLTVLSLGCWYGPLAGKDPSDGTAELGRMHDLFLNKVREHFMDVMEEESLEFVQLCTLLGSFYLYHVARNHHSRSWGPPSKVPNQSACTETLDPNSRKKFPKRGNVSGGPYIRGIGMFSVCHHQLRVRVCALSKDNMVGHDRCAQADFI